MDNTIREEDFINFLEACISRDEEAWNGFIAKYGKLIYNYILKTLKRYNFQFHSDEWEEIYNRIMASLLENDCRRLQNFRGTTEKSFTAYLREICFHNTVDFLRERKPFLDIEGVPENSSYDAGYNDLELKQLRSIISELKKELNPRHQLFFKLLFEEELNSEEIGRIMKLKLNAIHQLKFRLVNKLIQIAKKKNLYHDLETFIRDF
jgi:RNA polymerase sigma factor (sigma-70 family)